MVLGAICAPAAIAAPTPQKARPPVSALGSLTQLKGASGCLVDRSDPLPHCKRVRALSGPAPVLGSNAMAMSPNGKSLYVVSGRSDAIAIFKRNAKTGKLAQGKGTAGCVAVNGANGCGTARALDGPNSVAVSPDGKNVYATSVKSNSIAIFRRNAKTGALKQAPVASGCIAGVVLPGCTTGRALLGPDVVAISPDGKNVYVGAFAGSAIVTFDRDASTGLLTQPTDTTGCLVNVATDGCTTGLALGNPEGMAISGDGDNVYVAAPASNAVDTLTRNPSTGALSQASDGTGCITTAALVGCTTGVQMAGANAVAVSADDGDVYVTSLLSNSITSFTRASSGQLAQKSGTSACLIYVVAAGCSLGRAFNQPEGLAVSPDGASVYTAAYGSAAIDVLNRNSSGELMQKPRAAGCLTSSSTPDCTPARALKQATWVVVSPDGKYVYAAAFKSNAVDVFKRITKTRSGGKG